MIYVRKMREEDLDGLRELLLDNGELTDKEHISIEKLEHEDKYVCISNDKVCGYGKLIRNEAHCLVRDIYVSKESRREKIGSTVVKAMLNSAEIHGADIAILISNCEEFARYLRFEEASLSELPYFFKPYLNIDSKEKIYIVSLKDYFSCSCCS